jgi:predicted transcriptional regulator
MVADRRYNVTLGPKLDQELDQVAEDLDITKAEVMRRALTLFKHAVKADEVKLVTAGLEQNVLVK